MLYEKSQQFLENDWDLVVKSLSITKQSIHRRCFLRVLYVLRAIFFVMIVVKSSVALLAFFFPFSSNAILVFYFPSSNQLADRLSGDEKNEASARKKCIKRASDNEKNLIVGNDNIFHSEMVK